METTMDSLDEFQRIESMLQKSVENSLMKPQRKKHKSDFEMDCVTAVDNTNKRNDIVHLLEKIIVSELGDHCDPKRQDDIIKKLSHRLYTEIQRMHIKEVDTAEDVVVAEVEEIKQQMRQMVQCLNAAELQVSSSQDGSIELARRIQSNGNSRAILGNGDVNGNEEYNTKQILLDEMRLLEQKFQEERNAYLDETERLNQIIEEKSKTIEHLQTQKSNRSPVSSLATTSKNSFIDTDESKEYSRLQGYSSLQTNNRMLHVLSNLVQAFVDTDNDIRKHLETLGLTYKSTSYRGDDSHLHGFASLEDEHISELTLELCEDGPDLTPVYSNQSFNSTNDIEDDVVLGASRRLRQTVDCVLEILSEVVKNHSQHDIDKLTRQLIEKENLVHQLENEKKSLLEKATSYNEIKAEYEHLKLKLEEHERDRDRYISDNKRLEMDKSVFSQGLPQLQQKLRYENEILNRDIQHLQQDKRNLMEKITNLSSEVEMLKLEKEQILERKHVDLEELMSQLKSRDNNINSFKRFVEEQTQERESEREEFTKEMAILNEKLKEKEKNEAKLKSTVCSLESQIAMFSEEKVTKEEKLEEMSANLKLANLKVSELNLMVRQLEDESERFNQVELELRNKLSEVSAALNIKLNDETNWSDVIEAISKVVACRQAESVFNEKSPSQPEKNSQHNEAESEGTSLSSDNSVFLTIKLMNDKMNLLNEQIDQLTEKNSKLQKELEQSNVFVHKCQELKTALESLENNLLETRKQNEMLQQEINEQHMKYSELKVKLDSSVDVEEFKKVVHELKSKLQTEKRHTEVVSLKLEQANRHGHDLDEKLDAYKKEVQTYKEMLKSFEQENKERSESKSKYENVQVEVSQLNSLLATKEKTCAMLEQKVDLLNTKLNAITKEKDLYLEKLRSLDSNQEQILIYEKNFDKLRLQYKMATDKINYLELEIKSLRKKIEILEKENDYLKMENHKLLKLKHEVNAVMAVDSETDTESFTLTPIVNNVVVNGLDKLNSISSNNLLMLKVRRLLSQKGALIYQKNYLIHLLGGFQRTENDTLALLSNLNSSKDIEDYEMKLRGKQKFRSVAYAFVALSRMRYMVNIWQCRKRQLLLNKMAHSLQPNSGQNVPLPPKKCLSTSGASSPPGSFSSDSSPLHFGKHSLPGQINSTMKDYVDRLHVVHETLGLHTNKL